jgi:hypothetical protein
MSTISGTGQALNQLLQGLSSDVQARKGTGAIAPEIEPGIDPTASGAHRHRGHGNGPMFEKLGAAVIEALQSAQANGASDVDPNQVIEDTITQFLKDNNIPLPGRHVGGKSGGTEAEGGGAAGDVDQQHISRNPQVRAFFETLRSFGVDPNQFRKDFMTAIENARGGAVEPETALGSFPPGSSVDTTT